MPAAIEIDGLHVSYGNQRVLHGVDLSVAPGEFIAILGSSGCGKTTLLRTIAGFQKASKGAIRLFGRDVVNMPPHPVREAPPHGQGLFTKDFHHRCDACRF